MSLSVVILAAGQGKRMKSDLPKVLQPLAGRPLLAHVIATAKLLNPTALHVVYGHGGDAVKQALAHENLKWVLQAEQLGTGHAVAQAMPGVADDERVLVLYGDVPLIRKDTLEQLLSEAKDGALALLSVILADPTGYGRIVRDNAGQVVRIVEHKDANTKERAIRESNTGLLAVRAGLLRKWLNALRNDNSQGEYYLTDIVGMAVRDAVRINAVVAPTETEVLGVNDKVQLAQLEGALRLQRATELMVQGATLVDPARIDIRGEVAIGRDVFIDINAVFIGNVKLGHRVRIGPNIFIRDSEIGDDTEIFSNSVIDRAVVGPRCQVGPFARLRPEAKLHEEVHVGNFVEVKKSELLAGAKANHLTYIGDATVGARVNIGAGTITCNYDGVNKSRTEIGAGAFIGSGSMLVAPVKIGAGATIGAGSTITGDAPEGKLTIERAKQITIDGWKRPTKRSS